MRIGIVGWRAAAWMILDEEGLEVKVYAGAFSKRHGIGAGSELRAED